MFWGRGQATAEYLVVIGAVLVVTAVVIGATMQTGISESVAAQQSLIAWKSAAPFSITAFKLSSDSFSLSIVDSQKAPLDLTGIEFQYDEVILRFWMPDGSQSQSFWPGAYSATLVNSSFNVSTNPCFGMPLGSAFEFDNVTLIYTDNGLTGLREVGPGIAGQCAVSSSESVAVPSVESSPVPSPAPYAMLSGWVRDANGVGLPSALVNLTNSTPSQSAVANASGYYYLNVSLGGQSAVFAASSSSNSTFGSSSTAISFAAGTPASRNFTVGFAAASFNGIVLDVNGAAVFGATVSWGAASGSTNATGHYLLSNAAMSNLSVSNTMSVSKSPTYSPRSVAVSVVAGGSATTDFDAASSRQLNFMSSAVGGYALDEWGIGISDGNVSCGEYFSATAGDGLYAISGVAMSNAVLSCSLNASKFPTFVSNVTSINLSAGVTSAQNLVLSYANASVSGFVLDALGAGVSGATVSCGAFSSASASNGSFAINGITLQNATGYCNLSAAKSGYNLNYSNVSLSAGAATAGQNLTLIAPVAGTCGFASGYYTSSAPYGEGLCLAGTASSASNPGEDNYTKLLVHGEEATTGAYFSESSFQARNVTKYGGATQSYTMYKFGGGSWYFDGSGDYLSVGDSSDWHLADQPWTVDEWVRFSSVGNMGIWEMGQFNTAGGWEAFYYYSGKLYFFSDISGVAKANYYYTWTPTANTWYHLALERDGTNVYLFINGQLMTWTAASTPISTTSLGNSTSMKVGSETADSMYFNGYIDEFRFSKGIARWTSNFTPPSAPYTVGPWSWNCTGAQGGSNSSCATVAATYSSVSFTTAGTTTWTVPAGVTEVEYLVVAGGGGGGALQGGGGGAGGYVTNLGGAKLAVSGNVSITVGAGGAGGIFTGEYQPGASGGNSSLVVGGVSIIAVGGGGGGSASNNALNGGSGGGASRGYAKGTAAAGQGNDGGATPASSSPAYGASGGGGAGAAGSVGSSSYGGNGGAGLQNNIDGNNYYYAGGGGGGVNDASTAGSGGSGVGGTGGSLVSSPTSGTAGRGGGGGGAGSQTSPYQGGSGGSGVVILRHANNSRNAINGTCGTANGYGRDAIPSGADLCSAGTASSVSGSNPWSWSCIGAYGGTNASCATVTATYAVLSFTNGGTTTWSVPAGVTEVEYLVVAGGGGGGALQGGGGGAGGYVTNLGGTKLAVSGNVTVTVGAGGVGGILSESYQPGASGGNSSLVAGGASIIAVGGGGGGSASNNALNGGSGGGASRGYGKGTATAGQGNDGGATPASSSPAYGASGGGGAGAAGSVGSSSYGGNGGAGLQNNIDGNNYYYAGGGGGGVNDASTAGTGGSGVGGTGGSLVSAPTSGMAGRGGGGGGAGSQTSPYQGGSGGSGIVIIKYVNNSGSFSCGDAVSFGYGGSTVAYRSVLSAAGKCWLDRNLGASRPAVNCTDSAAYGDLFQWGRLADGHQLRNSTNIETMSSTDVPGHSSFINSSTNSDWRSPANDNLWQGVSGTNNPCPSGWRLPTSAEWDAEISAGSWTTTSVACASNLKMTLAGMRYHWGYLTWGVGSYGVYWASTVNGTAARQLLFGADIAYTQNYNRNYGMTARCIRN